MLLLEQLSKGRNVTREGAQLQPTELDLYG
jgi:hypothetical protein